MRSAQVNVKRIDVNGDLEVWKRVEATRLKLSVEEEELIAQEIHMANVLMQRRVGKAKS